MPAPSALHAPASRVGASSLPARQGRGALLMATNAVGKPATTTTTTSSISTTAATESPRVSPVVAAPAFAPQVSLALAAVAASASVLLAGPLMPAHAATVLEPSPSTAGAVAEAVAAAASSEPLAPAPPAPITQGFWRQTPPPPPAPVKRAPFLTKSGARGLLAEEEERLYNLRLEKEGEVIQELDRARAELLQEENEPGRAGKLCATPFGIDLVGILVFVALTGALVGGVSARSRKAEVERLNDQLRKINLSLRQQARAGTVYAPGLNYAPQPLSPAGRPLSELLRDSGENGSGGILASAAAAAAATSVAAPPQPSSSADARSSSSPSTSTSSSSQTDPSPSVVVSLDDEEVSAELRACVSALREGKRLLKEKQGPAAMVRFEKALMLAEALGDKVHEKRAVRGLAAAARLNGDRRGAIGHLRRVLALSDEAGEHVGDADACGNIADLYTELGQFERAAEFYDRYISRMATDGPV